MLKMKYLTREQLESLSPQRRVALWKSVKAKVGKYIDNWFDFEPDMLTPDQAELNEYRKLLERLVLRDGRQNPPKEHRKRQPRIRKKG